MATILGLLDPALHSRQTPKMPYDLKYVPAWVPFTQPQRFGHEGRQLGK